MDASSSGKSGELLIALPVAEFLERAGAAVPVPGGGGAAALVGASAVSMLEMALAFTVGRPRFAAVDQRARALLAEVTAARRRLAQLVDEDAAGYAKVAAAIKMPAKTPAEKELRAAATNAAMREAIRAPVEMVRILGATASLAREVLAISNPNLASDVGVAAAVIPGAARAAALNVWMNVPALVPEDARRVTADVRAALSLAEEACGDVVRIVESKLCPKKD